MAHVFKDFREQHALSQAELGAELGIAVYPQGRVSHYETGRSQIPIDVANAFIELAKKYGDAYSLEHIYPPASAVG